MHSRVISDLLKYFQGRAIIYQDIGRKVQQLKKDHQSFKEIKIFYHWRNFEFEKNREKIFEGIITYQYWKIIEVESENPLKKTEK